MALCHKTNPVYIISNGNIKVKEEKPRMKALSIPKEVEFILERLEKSGHRADVVGGPVRDFLLGKTPDDYDITTSALPGDVKRIFADYRTVDTGIKHGTVTLVLGKNQYEITTYRVDGEYKDARRPETVSFTDSLSEDLCRRDFTVNAMCYSPRHGVTDLHGGKADLEAKIIRAVGDPAIRFSEDALRILRALRFSSVLDFHIEEKTAAAAFVKKELLTLVSGERIYTEWKKLVSGVNAYSVIDGYRDIISVFLPELSSLSLPDRELFSRADGFVRTLGVFYLTLGESAPLSYSAAMRRLKTDRDTEMSGKEILSSVGKYDLSNRCSVRRMLSSLSEDRARALVRLEILLGRIEEGSEKIIDAVLSSGIPYKLSELSIGGDDLLRLGATGREVGRILNSLLSRVMDETLTNDREHLLSEALKEISRV